MSLKEKIQQFQDEMMKNTPQELLEKLQKSRESIISNNSGIKFLKENEQIPDFSLPNQTDTVTSLEDLIKKGPLVITFYRGGWCPYCNLELQSLQKNLNEIQALGANLIAISPEMPDKSLSVYEKNDLKFSILSDHNNLVAKKFGLVFELSPEVDTMYKNELNLDLAVNNSVDKSELPIPATYVIGKDKKIKYAFVNLDYTQRAEPSEIINILKKLN